MRLSVFDMVAKDTRFAEYYTGFEKPWRLTPRRGAQLFRDGRRRRGFHSAT